MMYSKEQLESLPPEEKRALLARLLKSRMEMGNSYPLSLGQRGLWYLQQLEPANTAYNIPLVFFLGGDVQIEALRNSFNFIVQRHPVLRTVFTMKDGQPIQQVLPWTPIALPIRLLQDQLEENPDSQVMRLLYEQSRRPMDLEKGPLFWAELLKLSETRYALLLTLHHIIFD